MRPDAWRHPNHPPPVNLRALGAVLCGVTLLACGVKEKTYAIVDPAPTADIPALWTRAEAPTIDLSNVNAAVLHAWEDTRLGLPPLAVTRGDSLAALVQLLIVPRSLWYDTKASLPGIALPVHFMRGDSVVARAAFLEVTHDQGGFFLVTRGSTMLARQATARELSTFLSLFGIGVVTQQ